MKLESKRSTKQCEEEERRTCMRPACQICSLTGLMWPLNDLFLTHFNFNTSTFSVLFTSFALTAVQLNIPPLFPRQRGKIRSFAYTQARLKKQTWTPQSAKWMCYLVVCRFSTCIQSEPEHYDTPHPMGKHHIPFSCPKGNTQKHTMSIDQWL